MVLMLRGAGRRHVARGRPQGPDTVTGRTRLSGQVTLLRQRRLRMREGDGDGGVVGEGGRVELWRVSGVAGPLVGVQRGDMSSSTVLHARVVVMERSMLLKVVLVVGVRPAQHQPPT